MFLLDILQDKRNILLDGAVKDKVSVIRINLGTMNDPLMFVIEIILGTDQQTSADCGVESCC